MLTSGVDFMHCQERARILFSASVKAMVFEGMTKAVETVMISII